MFVHGGAATPIPLLEALANYAKKAALKDVHLFHIHTEGPGVCQGPEYEGTYMVIFKHDLYLLRPYMGKCLHKSE